MTQLSPHFSLAELTVTSHGDLGNEPNEEAVEHLTIVAENLEHVRALLGNLPVTINSGYRSPAVNAAVGGVSDSAHLTGYAADFVCPEFGTPLDICRFLSGSDIRFDQVIEEGAWVHISFAPTRRQQVLTKKPAGGYRLGLP